MSDPKMGGLCGFSLRYDGVLPLPIEKRDELFHFTTRNRGALTSLIKRERSSLSHHYEMEEHCSCHQATDRFIVLLEDKR